MGNTQSKCESTDHKWEKKDWYKRNINNPATLRNEVGMNFRRGRNSDLWIVNQDDEVANLMKFYNVNPEKESSFYWNFLTI